MSIGNRGFASVAHRLGALFLLAAMSLGCTSGGSSVPAGGAGAQAQVTVRPATPASNQARTAAPDVVPSAAAPDPATEEPEPTDGPEPTEIPRAFTSLNAVKAGGTATAKVKTAAGASCSIVVEYKSGTIDRPGAGRKKANGSGFVSWSWKVRTRTTKGNWPVTAYCGKGDADGSATKNLKVT